MITACPVALRNAHDPHVVSRESLVLWPHVSILPLHSPEVVLFQLSTRLLLPGDSQPWFVLIKQIYFTNRSEILCCDFLKDLWINAIRFLNFLSLMVTSWLLRVSTSSKVSWTWLAAKSCRSGSIDSRGASAPHLQKCLPSTLLPREDDDCFTCCE